MIETKSDASLRATEQITKFNSRLTPEQRRENARNAGVASGQARRKKRLMKDTITEILVAEIPPELADIRCQLQELGLPCDLQTAMCYAALNRAIKGDIEACRWVRDTSGNKLAENLNVSATEEKPFAQLDLSSLSNAELMRMLNDCAETSEDQT